MELSVHSIAGEHTGNLLEKGWRNGGQRVKLERKYRAVQPIVSPLIE